MHTTIPSKACTRILAIDLGKYQSVACRYDKDPQAAQFLHVTTDESHLRRLLARYRPKVVVIEACLLAGWVHDLCAQLGLVCQVANTASEAWKFKHLKRKTDRDDALRLAQLYALGQLPTVAVPPPQTRQRRALIVYRQRLVGQRVRVQNRIRALFVAQGLPAPRGHRAWTVSGLQGLAQHAKPLAECGPAELWPGLLELALTEYQQLRQWLDVAVLARHARPVLVLMRERCSSAALGAGEPLTLEYRNGPERAQQHLVRRWLDY